MKVNYPWVELRDAGNTKSYVININSIIAVYDNKETMYSSGVFLNTDAIIVNILQEDLTALKEYLMKLDDDEDSISSLELAKYLIGYEEN